MLIFANVAWADLKVHVEANPDPARPGETVNVSIHVTNTGSSTLNNVVLDMAVPQEVDEFAEALASNGGACDTLGFNTVCEQDELVVWSLGSISAGDGRVVSIPPQIRSDALTPTDGTQVSFIANASANGLDVVSDTALVEVQASPFLDLGMVESESPVEAGDELTYTLSFGHTATSRLAPGTVLS
ncbi:MAG: COG1361 family protein, partial [bacterium]